MRPGKSVGEFVEMRDVEDLTLVSRRSTRSARQSRTSARSWRRRIVEEIIESGVNASMIVLIRRSSCSNLPLFMVHLLR